MSAAPATIAAVAPNVSHKPTSAIDSGETIKTATRSTPSRGPAPSAGRSRAAQGRSPPSSSPASPTARRPRRRRTHTSSTMAAPAPSRRECQSPTTRPRTSPARMAMLPPEMAMTWYVPASCSRLFDHRHQGRRDRRSGSRRRSPPTARARTRRDARSPCEPPARAAAAVSSNQVPPLTTSTSAALFIDPTSDRPRRASIRSWSGTPALR